jgi:hypothetical protein
MQKYVQFHFPRRTSSTSRPTRPIQRVFDTLLVNRGIRRRWRWRSGGGPVQRCLNGNLEGLMTGDRDLKVYTGFEQGQLIRSIRPTV